MIEVIIVIVIILIVLFLWSKRTAPNVFNSNIYFDNNGTTQPHAEVVKAMTDASYLGNASASYAWEAKQKIDELKKKISNWCNAPLEQYDIIITSGASEANNFIIRGVIDSWTGNRSAAHSSARPHIIMSSFEHKTSLDCAKQLELEGRAFVTLVKPDMFGNINANDIESAITPQTVLISVMHANNELGNIINIRDIAAVSHRNNVPFHTDAVQTFGKMKIPMSDWGITALSMSFHKLHGPLGIGALIIERKMAATMPAQIAGSQNNYLRGGTENMPAIVGANVAMDITHTNRAEKNAHMLKMKQIIVHGLTEHFSRMSFADFVGKTDEDAEAMLATMPVCQALTPKCTDPKGIVFLGPIGANGLPNDNTLPNTLLVSVVNLHGSRDGSKYPRFCNIKLKSDLATTGVIVSIGSACQTGEKGASHVLHQLRAPFVIRCGVVRISLGDFNTEADAHEFVKKFAESAYLQSR